MPTHVVIGRGGTATATALSLAETGDRVRMVSRSGLGPTHPDVEPIALDALDTTALSEIATGASTVFNMAMPAYHTWPETVPPLFGSILSAAETVGADLVMLGNLYGYGPVDGVVSEQTPLSATGSKGVVRAAMWADALAAHEAGRLRVTEVRAGQFLGAGAVSVFSLFVQPAVLSGIPAKVPQELDLAHSYTAIGDAAAALVAVARDERSWGRAWHAPVITATVREIANRLAELADVAAPELVVLTDAEIAEFAEHDPFWTELFETKYMSHREFLVDDSAMRTTFGSTASKLDEVLAEVVAAGAAVRRSVPDAG
ncbi:Rossmann-fold NAD(P)-binding domain-containing protein [Nocardia fluminea]|uniref:Nucleoside-diphosphate-sugar epimerase n=1 Tax=Nocardia fluminea TaxID=134984 RepID=A0A2N3VEP6_9NOCA|nr:NAD-dependent epimerase [Nocardia fluminea]PKV80102.1 nucleoside-diphosphate-sugar epimerase [Nocardia fluminea]